MITANKVYITNVSLVRKESEQLVESTLTDYCLENAIKNGINMIKDEFYEFFEQDATNQNDIENFINNHTQDFTFSITIISGNRKIFKTSEEILEYFKNHINKVSNENLYDFLLSLVESDTIFLDCTGNHISNSISAQCPVEEGACITDIEFSEETCKTGKYMFSYNNMGVDTLHNSTRINKI